MLRAGGAIVLAYLASACGGAWRIIKRAAAKLWHGTFGWDPLGDGELIDAGWDKGGESRKSPEGERREGGHERRAGRPIRFRGPQ
jgi:hypothetical protein